MITEFGKRLMLLRRQKGLSQEELGDKVGVTRQTVSRWELGETAPEMEKLIALADVFDLTLDELTGRSSGAEQQSKSVCPTMIREYRSEKTLFGLPLVHICFSADGFSGKARGVFAMGNRAEGIVAVGGLARGIISFGGVSMGVVSIGGASLGLLLSLGGISVGLGLSVGGLALGGIAIGGLAAGLYALGGGAFALRVASGEFARAPIAIGNQPSGEIRFFAGDAFDPGAVESAIRARFPDTPDFLIGIFRSPPH